MVLCRCLFLSLIPFILFGSSVVAQANGFQWSFSGSVRFTKTLTQCGNYPLTVQSLSANTSEVGTPPYYLIAYKPLGTPATSLLGSDINNLSWTVNQPSGSSLLLTVVDSQGAFGGVSDDLLTVDDGESNCLPSTPLVNVTIGANVTKIAEICEPIGFRVYGGKKPYNITLVGKDSRVLTNITIGPTDDVFTYTNRGEPSSNLMASVIDANGVPGTSSELFAIAAGSLTSISCPGLISSSGNSSVIDQHPKQPSRQHKRTSIIAATIPTTVLLLLALGACMIWRRNHQAESEPALLPDAWQGPTTYSPYESESLPISKLANSRGMLREHSRSSSRIGMPRSVSRQSSSNIKGQRTLPDRPATLDDSYHTPRSRLPPGVSSERVIELDFIIQHHDGGAFQENPPTYAEAATGSSLVAAFEREDTSLSRT